MYIGFTGFAGSGKDTCAGILKDSFGYQHFAFADKLKALALQINPTFTSGSTLADIVTERGWEHAKHDPDTKADVRGFLQELGHGERVRHGDTVWIDRVMESIREAGAGPDIALSDVRYDNEAQWLLGQGGAVFRVVRDGVGPANGHITEKVLPDHLLTATIDNNGSLTELTKNLVLELIELLTSTKAA